MQDSMTMAEVGSIVKVSGSSIATPFGPPNPGSTPTKMPSTSPTMISASIFQASRTAKPCSKRPKASIEELSWLAHASVAERGFERPLRHDDVKRDIEGHEHRSGEEKSGQQRFPQRDASDHSHEGRDQQEAGDIEPEKLRRETKQQRRNEHRHHAPKLRAGDEGFRNLLARQQADDEPIEAGAGDNDRQVKPQIPALRPPRTPTH